MSRKYMRFTEEETEELRREVNSFVALGKYESDAFKELAKKGLRNEFAYRDKWNQMKRRHTIQKPFVLDAVKELIEENVELKKRVYQLEKEQAESKPMQEEYQSLLEIINRARKQIFVDEEPKQKFKMDSNGNLERIDE